MADVQALMGILGSLPQIMGTVQIIVYIFLVLFFGSIAIIGYRGYLGFLFKLLLRLGAGFLSLLGGLAIGSSIPFLNGSIFKLFQLDMIVGGILSSAVFAVSFYLLSFWMKAGNIEQQIKRLENKLGRMKKRAERPKMLMIIGAVVFVAFLVYIMLNFRGFPNLQEDIFSSLGISDDVANMMNRFGSMSAECAGAMSAITSSALQNPAPYEDQALRAEIESSSGGKIVSIQRFDINGKAVVIAILDNGKNCVATEKELCVCME